MPNRSFFSVFKITTKPFLWFFVFVLLTGSEILIGQNDTLEFGIGALNRIGCSIIGSEINIVGTGNVHANKAFLNSETTLDELDMNFCVRIDSIDSAGAFLFSIGKYSGIAGTMVEFQGTDSTSVINVNKLNGITPTFVTQFILPFNLELGLNYNIRVGKRVRSLIIEVISSDSSEVFFNDSLSYPTPFFGCLWGTPFLGCGQGGVSVSNFLLSTPLNKAPRLAVWGDSFIEGNSLPLAEQRYVSLIMDSIGHHNVSIMGKGGENSSSMASRFNKERSWFSNSKYALVAVGVNDNNFTSWKNNLVKYLDSLKKYKTIPIIATLSPRADRLAFIVQANNWIRTVYDGAYIDVNFALSADGTTWIPGMTATDSIHPTPAGHQAIYDRIKIEAPYIFMDNDRFTIDYITETTVEIVGDTLEYSDFSNFTLSTLGATTNIPVVPAQNIYFRDTTNVPGINTIYYILTPPQRPTPPSGPLVSGGVFDWTNNPLFPNVSDYEFSDNAGISWSTCLAKPIVLPGIGSVIVRVKATLVSFKSAGLILNDLSTSVASRVIDEPFVYPNPMADKLVIKNIYEATTLSVFAADGRMVKTLLLENESNEINVEELSEGFYILVLNNKTGQRNFKVTKK